MQAIAKRSDEGQVGPFFGGFCDGILNLWGGGGCARWWRGTGKQGEYSTSPGDGGGIEKGTLEKWNGLLNNGKTEGTGNEVSHFRKGMPKRGKNDQKWSRPPGQTKNWEGLNHRDFRTENQKALLPRHRGGGNWVGVKIKSGLSKLKKKGGGKWL